MYFFTVPDEVRSASIRFSVPSLERVGNGVTAQNVINGNNDLVSSLNIQLAIKAVYLKHCQGKL